MDTGTTSRSSVWMNDLIVIRCRARLVSVAFSGGKSCKLLGGMGYNMERGSCNYELDAPTAKKSKIRTKTAATNTAQNSSI